MGERWGGERLWVGARRVNPGGKPGTPRGSSPKGPHNPPPRLSDDSLTVGTYLDIQPPPLPNTPTHTYTYPNIHIHATPLHSF